MLRTLPLLRHIGCQAPACRVLHNQRQVLPNRKRCQLLSTSFPSVRTSQKGIQESEAKGTAQGLSKQAYLVGEDGLLCFNDVDMPFPKVCLYLRA